MHDEEAWEEHGEHEGRRHRHGGRTRMRMGPPGPGGPRTKRGGWGPGWGPGPEMWLGRGKFMRGPRVKRGDVRAAALALLAEEPRNGYQIIQAFLKTNKIDPASVTIVPVQFDPAQVSEGALRERLSRAGFRPA